MDIDRAEMPGGLRPLSELDDYEVAEGYPDIRGWTLYDETGRDIGEVKDLLIDTSRDMAVYATIDLNDKNWFRELFDNEESARVPLTAVTLDEDNDAIRLTRPLAEVAGRGAAGFEHEAAGFRAGAARDEAADTVDVVEERVDVKKGRKKAGEVKLKKDVETETVHRTVPLEREEVVVERERVDRELAPGEAAARFEGREGEISVPVYREEVEISKRPVVAERLRIRKRSVPEQRDVTAEVRKEHVRVEGSGVAESVRGERAGEFEKVDRGEATMERDEAMRSTGPVGDRDLVEDIAEGRAKGGENPGAPGDYRNKP
jgi:uncharacterized protein (TIGR02271 family)